MSAIIIDSEIVHYEVLGRGRPLIFLHGWVGSWRYWIPAMQAASNAYRAYAIDMWGFGDSSKPSERYTLTSQVELLDRFLEEMGIGKIALIGHGLGAIVALLYAQKSPRFVDRVLTVGFPLESSHINERLQAATPSELAEWLLSGIPGSEAAVQEAPKVDMEAIKSSLDNIRELDLRKLAVELSIPCLLVHGEDDPAVTIPPTDKLDNNTPLLHQIIFENAGHYPMLNEPNKFNRLLTDFLSLNPGESPQKLQLKEEWKRRVR